MQDQAERRGNHFGDWREILDRVIGQRRKQLRALRMRRIGEQQRVAVGHGLGNEFGADDAGCGRTVIDHHGLPDTLSQALADVTRGVIAAAAGGQRDDDADRTVGEISLGTGRAGNCACQCEQGAGRAFKTT